MTSLPFFKPVNFPNSQFANHKFSTEGRTRPARASAMLTVPLGLTHISFLLIASTNSATSVFKTTYLPNTTYYSSLQLHSQIPNHDNLVTS